MMNRRAFSGLLAAGGLGSATRALGASAVPADLDILERAFKALHPGLYRYSTPEVVDARFAALRRTLSASNSHPEAYLALSRFTAAVRCGHTYLNPLNQKKAIAAELFSARTAPPFLFVWRRDMMVVTSSLDPRLPRGAVVSAVNGVATGEILRRMMPLARADGSVDAKRIADLELTGLERIAAFDAFLPFVAPGARETVRVEAATPDARTSRTLELGAIAPADRKALFPQPAAGGDPPWTLAIDDGVAVLRMPTWALFDKDSKWPAWLEAAFDRLVSERARGLVIDLRGNEGGADVGRAILSRLIERDVQLPAYRRYVRYRRVPDELLPHLETWDKSFRDWGEAAKGPEPDGFYRLVRSDDDETGRDLVRSNGRRYTGRVAVLTEPANSSATFQFALAVRTLGIGELVGRPTGGNLRGINGGAFFFLQLPESGLEVDLPLIATRPDRPQPDAGLLPDVEVVNSAADIASGRDRELERARALVA